MRRRSCDALMQIETLVGKSWLLGGWKSRVKVST
jgi:hypothetical protein